MPDVQVRPPDEPSTGADEAAAERLRTVLDAAVGLRLTIIGGLAFVAGAIEEYSASRNPPMVAVIVGGLLNPVFFIGFPLGIYWIRRSKKSQPLAVIDSGKPDSTVSCEEQEQPCRVDRFVWRFFVTFTCVITYIFLGIVGGYWLTPMEELNKSSTGSSSHATSAQVGSPGADSGLQESYRRIWGLISAERYAEAMNACNEQIAVSPDDPHFYFHRAMIRALSTHDYVNCLRDLDWAITKIEARPPSPELNQLRSTCLNQRVRCCLCLQQQESGSAQWLDRAWADVNEIIRANPKDGDAFSLRGIECEYLGNLKGAR